MLQILRMGVAVFGVAALASGAIQPAEAACQLIKATASAGSKADAAKSSQALAVQSAADMKRSKRWHYVTLYAHKVKADPFWKAVRPDGPPREAVLKPDITTTRFFTTCFTGVVVPYVCTTGSIVCGQ
jgi:D-arabinose 1-dehydrogenase-like Zn-dependent alcohol dehydrogenase